MPTQFTKFYKPEKDVLHAINIELFLSNGPNNFQCVNRCGVNNEN